MRVVFVENNDSFSCNVLDLLPVDPRAVVTVRGGTAAAARAARDADCVVVGPGPMDPHRAGLVGLVRRVAQRGTPLLGICLGHQAIGLAFGARLRRSPPVHGAAHRCTFHGARLFPGVRGACNVMRYHSLSLTEVAEPLRVVATLADGTVMAVEHATLPVAGLQFHPDSFGTPRGREMVHAFFGAAGLRAGSRRAPVLAPALPRAAPPRGRARVLRLVDLEERDEFALLGPGYGGRWLLVDPQTRGARHAEARWVGFEGETGRVTGVPVPVDPIFDDGAPPLDVLLDARGFLGGVAHIRRGIAAGDVYQVNLACKARVECPRGSALLSRLCRRAVPRFAAWVRTRGFELVSASPEMLFDLRGRCIRVEPMKGTAPAGQAERLRASGKDRAELAMITDLLRDDLHALCVPGSVRVLRERRFIHLPYAVQAVSDVQGTLPRSVSLDTALARLHPGGSVTGAPRPAAVEFIRALERTPRGPYCGTLGLVQADRARFALLIRTATRTGRSLWEYGVGAGITWNSDAHAELAELRVKLGALR